MTMPKVNKLKRVDVTASITIDENDRDRLLAEGFKPIVRWVEGRSDTAIKTADALAIINGRAAGRSAKASPHDKERDGG
jgi:hypothetical protein